MKKWLIGCGIVLLVVLIAGGVAFYHFIWKPGSALVQGGLQEITEITGRVGALGKVKEQMAALNAGIMVKDFAAPGDGVIGAEQLARWLTVELAVKDSLAASMKTAETDGSVETRTTTTTGADGTTSTDTSVTVADGFALISNLGDAGLEAKRAQVAALNAASMSLAEYTWVRDAGLAALIAGGINLSALESNQSMTEALEAARVAMAESRKAIEMLPPEARKALEQIPGMLPLPETAPAPGAAPPAASDPTAAAPDASATTPDPVVEANFALVKDHAEAFARARGFAAFGL